MYRDILPGLKQQEHKADHLSLSSVEVKNEWRFTSIQPYVFMAGYLKKHKNNLTSYSTFRILQIQYTRLCNSHSLVFFSPNTFHFRRMLRTESDFENLASHCRSLCYRPMDRHTRIKALFFLQEELLENTVEYRSP